MITKEFLEKHYKFHDKLVLYTPDDIKLTFSKEPHYHMEGAETGVTTAEITFDDVINLYMSVKPKYRKNDVWVMNDETALALRKLKDADGNYIWNHNTDTILGKPVYILEYMPGVTSGSKPREGD